MNTRSGTKVGMTIRMCTRTARRSMSTNLSIGMNVWFASGGVNHGSAEDHDHGDDDGADVVAVGFDGVGY